MKRWLLGTITLALVATVPIPAKAVPAAADILDSLRAIPGLTVIADRRPPAGYARFFSLTYRQPVDHQRPSAGTFEQRLTLLHKALDQPLVLHTSGYDVFWDRPFRSEPTFLLGGTNQIAVEQRFFTPSRPQPPDWTKLNIWQAATDHHRIVAAFKSIYQRRWISAGESKGGFASVAHRRFYPSDVDATVAYVAPIDVVNSDDAHTRFLDNVGSDPACRATLSNLQREALNRRGAMVAKYTAWAQANKQTFNRIMGSADRAFELLVLETPWVFWMTLSQAHCRVLPPINGTTDQLYAWFDRVAGFSAYTDQYLDFYVPYYYQAGTQMGYPSILTPHLDGLLRYPGLFSAASFVPRDIPMTTFDSGAMADLDTWVRTQGSRLLFVYGGNDPWSAEPFRLGSGTTDSLWYTIAGENHGADIGSLPAGQRAQAQAALRRWAGMTTSAPATFTPGLDDVGPARQRAARLVTAVWAAPRCREGRSARRTGRT